jgi:hypothetical protein
MKKNKAFEEEMTERKRKRDTEPTSGEDPEATSKSSKSHDTPEENSSSSSSNS